MAKPLGSLFRRPQGTGLSVPDLGSSRPPSLAEQMNPYMPTQEEVQEETIAQQTAAETPWYSGVLNFLSDVGAVAGTLTGAESVKGALTGDLERSYQGSPFAWLAGTVGGVGPEWQRTDFADVRRAWGLKDDNPIFSQMGPSGTVNRFLLDFIGEVAFDPATYLTLGAAAIPKLGRIQGLIDAAGGASRAERAAKGTWALSALHVPLSRITIPLSEMPWLDKLGFKSLDIAAAKAVDATIYGVKKVLSPIVHGISKAPILPFKKASFVTRSLGEYEKAQTQILEGFFEGWTQLPARTQEALLKEPAIGRVITDLHELGITKLDDKGSILKAYADFPEAARKAALNRSLKNDARLRDHWSIITDAGKAGSDEWIQAVQSVHRGWKDVPLDPKWVRDAGLSPRAGVDVGPYDTMAQYIESANAELVRAGQKPMATPPGSEAARLAMEQEALAKGGTTAALKAELHQVREKEFLQVWEQLADLKTTDPKAFAGFEQWLLFHKAHIDRLGDIGVANNLISNTLENYYPRIMSPAARDLVNGRYEGVLGKVTKGDQAVMSFMKERKVTDMTATEWNDFVRLVGSKATDFTPLGTTAEKFSKSAMRNGMGAALEKALFPLSLLRKFRKTDPQMVDWFITNPAYADYLYTDKFAHAFGVKKAWDAFLNTENPAIRETARLQDRKKVMAMMQEAIQSGGSLKVVTKAGAGIDLLEPGEQIRKIAATEIRQRADIYSHMISDDLKGTLENVRGGYGYMVQQLREALRQGRDYVILPDGHPGAAVQPASVKQLNRLFKEQDRIRAEIAGLKEHQVYITERVEPKPIPGMSLQEVPKTGREAKLERMFTMSGKPVSGTRGLAEIMADPAVAERAKGYLTRGQKASETTRDLTERLREIEQNISTLETTQNALSGMTYPPWVDIARRHAFFNRTLAEYASLQKKADPGQGEIGDVVARLLDDFRGQKEALEELLPAKMKPASSEFRDVQSIRKTRNQIDQYASQRESLTRDLTGAQKFLDHAASVADDLNPDAVDNYLKMLERKTGLEKELRTIQKSEQAARNKLAGLESAYEEAGLGAEDLLVRPKKFDPKAAKVPASSTEARSAQVGAVEALAAKRGRDSLRLALSAKKGAKVDPAIENAQRLIDLEIAGKAMQFQSLRESEEALRAAMADNVIRLVTARQGLVDKAKILAGAQRSQVRGIKGSPNKDALLDNYSAMLFKHADEGLMVLDELPPEARDKFLKGFGDGEMHLVETESLDEARRLIGDIRKPDALKATPGFYHATRLIDKFGGWLRKNMVLHPALLATRARDYAQNQYMLGSVGLLNGKGIADAVMIRRALSKAQHTGRPVEEFLRGKMIPVTGMDGTVGNVDLADLVQTMQAGGIAGHGFVRDELVRGASDVLDLNRKGGRKVMSMIAGVLGLGGQGNPVLAAGGRFAHYLDDLSRIEGTMSGIRSGMPVDIAMSEVKKWVYGSTTLRTPFERSVMSRAFMFWPFRKWAIARNFERLVTRPGQLKMEDHLQRAAYENPPFGGGEIDRKNMEAILPRFLSENFAVPYLNTPEGPRYVLFGSLMPSDAIRGLVNAAGDVVHGKASASEHEDPRLRRIARFVGSDMLPPWRLMLQNMLDENLYTGTPVENYPGENTERFGIPMSKSTAQMLDSLRVLKEINNLNIVDLPRGLVGVDAVERGRRPGEVGEAPFLDRVLTSALSPTGLVGRNITVTAAEASRRAAIRQDMALQEHVSRLRSAAETSHKPGSAANVKVLQGLITSDLAEMQRRRLAMAGYEEPESFRKTQRRPLDLRRYFRRGG